MVSALAGRRTRPVFVCLFGALLAAVALVLTGSASYASPPLSPAPLRLTGNGALVARPAADAGRLPQMSGKAGAGDPAPSKPAAPYVVLYDQYNNPGANNITSQNFETAYNQYDAQAADDFTVPSGQSWSVNLVEVDGTYSVGGGPAASVNVYFYTNSGALPGTEIASRLGVAYAPGPGSGDMAITLSPAVPLSAGHYWVSVQANQDFSPYGQWFWTDRTVQSSSGAAWRNPGGGFAVGCTTWGTRGTTCASYPAQPDQVFRLSGSLTTVTPTATSTPCGITIVGSITNSDTVQDGRLNRASPSTCGNQNQCPGVMDTQPRHYDSYSFQNVTGDITCINIRLDMGGCAAGGQPAGAAFLDGSGYAAVSGRASDGLIFNPLDLCTNYWADSGTISGTVAFWSFNLLPGQTIVLVVNETVPGQGCASYTLAVSGCVVQTSCPVQFTDVPTDNPFYSFIRCLACRSIISGYADGSFRPGADITRGQISKIVSNAARFAEDPGPQVFEDVPPSHPFYQWINRLANRTIMGGYRCGLIPTEPCIPPLNRPYFRPGLPATRGQISKIVSNAAGYNDPPTTQTFEDVPTSDPFYDFIERLSSRGIIGGYRCGLIPSEPCIPPLNRPYFRPGNHVTRGQTTKIVGNTFYPNCITPGAP